MIEIVLVNLAAPEIHIRNLKVRPEMTRRVTVRQLVMFRSTFAVGEPLHGVVAVEVFGMRSQELDSFGPERGNTLRRVVEVDGEAVGLVVVFHVAEDIVIDIAEEMDVWFDAPIPLRFLQRRMLVEHAAIPSTHLVVGLQVPVFNVLLFQNLRGLLVEFFVNPFRHLPVFFWNDFCLLVRSRATLKCRVVAYRSCISPSSPPVFAS